MLGGMILFWRDEFWRGNWFGGDMKNEFKMIPILGEFSIHHNHYFIQSHLHKLANEWIWNSPMINSSKQSNKFEIHGFKSLNSSTPLVNLKIDFERHELVGTQSLMKFAHHSPKLINSSSSRVFMKLWLCNYFRFCRKCCQLCTLLSMSLALCLLDVCQCLIARRPSLHITFMLYAML